VGWETEYERYRAAAAASDPATSVVWAGEGVDLITAIAPAEAVVARLVHEAETALEAAARAELVRGPRVRL
jgi:nitronate monooxygenase